MVTSTTQSIIPPINSETNSALDMPVTALTGVGSKVAEQLTQLGIVRIFDLLLHLPRDYEDRSRQVAIADIAQFSDADLEDKLQDAGLIRHIGKLKAIRDNAIAWQHLTQELQQQQINVSDWLWSFVADQTLHNDVPDYRQAPAQTEISVALSKALKKKGFKFVGPTTCYAFMQAVGMIDDHENHCSFKSF